MKNLNIQLNNGQNFDYQWNDFEDNVEKYSQSVIFEFTENDHDCDCNLQRLLDVHNNCEKEEVGGFDPYPCGEKLKVIKITHIISGDIIWDLNV